MNKNQLYALLVGIGAMILSGGCAYAASVIPYDGLSVWFAGISIVTGILMIACLCAATDDDLK